MTRTMRRTAVAILAAGLLAATSSVTASVANADTPDFYQPPTTLPAGAGKIVKTEPSPFFLNVPGVSDTWPGNAHTIMYTSNLEDGSPVATTGVLIDPTFPWRGPGPQPTIVMPAGTVGQGDQCAPSKNVGNAVNIQISPNLSLPVNYNLIDADAMLTLGVRVVMPDYIGLGTPGIHTYVNRIEQGNAVIDATKAANEFWNLPASTPVAFWGYSQGGGAAASAAELVGARAPELNVIGTYAGAADPDLHKVLERADGSFLTGAVGYTLNGLLARDPELQPIIDRRLNDKGKQWLAMSATQCVIDTALTSIGTKTSDYTVDGKSFKQVIAEEPALSKALDRQKLGTIAPASPVYLHTSLNDDIVPHYAVEDLKNEWCALGARVEFTRDNITPPILTGTTLNHDFGAVTAAPFAVSFLLDRINGAPVKSAC
ncbi:hypothetical protein ABH922_000446 [Rhodococcus sp. 27YEA15]|uniref:lipase family protein n=1 Tax=Rhodococcus sp. 27YEA15 TaxID=3156259 RepID=UPI003C7DB46D